MNLKISKFSLTKKGVIVLAILALAICCVALGIVIGASLPHQAAHPETPKDAQNLNGIPPLADWHDPAMIKLMDHLSRNYVVQDGSVFLDDYYLTELKLDCARVTTQQPDDAGRLNTEEMAYSVFLPIGRMWYGTSWSEWQNGSAKFFVTKYKGDRWKFISLGNSAGELRKANPDNLKQALLKRPTK